MKSSYPTFLCDGSELLGVGGREQKTNETQLEFF